MTAPIMAREPRVDVRELPAVAALAAVSVTVAFAFARVFASDRYVVPVVIAALLPHAIGLACRALRQHAVVEAIVSAVTLVVVVLVAVPGTGAPGALIDQAGAGWSVARTDPVPIRATDGAVLLAVVIVWAVAAIADQLAFRRDAALGALAPGVVVVIWCTALGTHDGQWITIASFGAASVAFIALQHQVLLDHRRTRIGRRRLVDAPGLVVIGIVVGLLAIGLGVAGAAALPDANTPLVHVAGLGDDTGNRTYRTSVPPLLDVGAKLDQPSTETLFTVGADRPAYWRITALDDYRSAGGGQWTLTASGDDAVSEGLDASVPKDALLQDYEIGPLGERWMPAAFEPVRVSTTNTLVVRASSTLVTGDATVTGKRYRVTSATPPSTLTVAQHDAAAGPVPSGLRQYTQVPADVPAVVASLAQQITAGIDNPADRATALRDYFRDGSFTYDPTVDLTDGRDATEQFLEIRRGFCVQFASTFALMARSVGIPARVAVGFTPGTKDPTSGRYVVTNHDSHAWPEVWLHGVGWTNLYDPTPPSDLPGGSNLPGEAPPLTPQPTTSGTGGTTPVTSPPVTVPSPNGPPQPSPNPAPTPSGGGVNIAADDSSQSSVPWPLLLVAFGLLVLLAPLVTVLALKARRRRRRRHRGDPADAITGAWREAMDTLADHRFASPPAETPLELARRVPSLAGDETGPPLQVLARAYTATRYGETVPPADGVDSAWTAVDALRRALDASGTTADRLRARFAPGTLRREHEADRART